jgi:hypothetical protein
VANKVGNPARATSSSHRKYGLVALPTASVVALPRAIPNGLVMFVATMAFISLFTQREGLHQIAAERPHCRGPLLRDIPITRMSSVAALHRVRLRVEWSGD